MSTAVANLVESEREAIRRTLNIPEPEAIFYDPPTGDPEKGIALLKSWYEEDDSEEPQAETLAYLKRVLDEDRLSPDRKLFS